ncbi:hypothetical protein EDI28_11835 [Photobacterium chitinilyticum]|uniref:Uncharacterized protein n=1 Tax=Photobacterium chitinilyticum TaxID=2485123 RepID=A0A444JQ72_9GAMM|nr:hypothetical protein EDI28_11835 [Photobacterium chitinilyticum]
MKARKNALRRWFIPAWEIKHSLCRKALNRAIIEFPFSVLFTYSYTKVFTYWFGIEFGEIVTLFHLRQRMMRDHVDAFP